MSFTPKSLRKWRTIFRIKNTVPIWVTWLQRDFLVIYGPSAVVVVGIWPSVMRRGGCHSLWLDVIFLNTLRTCSSMNGKEGASYFSTSSSNSCYEGRGETRKPKTLLPTYTNVLINDGFKPPYVIELYVVRNFAITQMILIFSEDSCHHDKSLIFRVISFMAYQGIKACNRYVHIWCFS